MAFRHYMATRDPRWELLLGAIESFRGNAATAQDEAAWEQLALLPNVEELKD